MRTHTHVYMYICLYARMHVCMYVSTFTFSVFFIVETRPSICDLNEGFPQGVQTLCLDVGALKLCPGGFAQLRVSSPVAEAWFCDEAIFSAPWCSVFGVTIRVNDRTS